MLAKVLPGFLKLNSIQIIEAEFVAITDCADYDHYKSLPSAIEVEGILLGKTGWSSDSGIACYKQGVTLGKLVDLKA